MSDKDFHESLPPFLLCVLPHSLLGIWRLMPLSLSFLWLILHCSNHILHYSNPALKPQRRMSFSSFHGSYNGTNFTLSRILTHVEFTRILEIPAKYQLIPGNTHRYSSRTRYMWIEYIKWSQLSGYSATEDIVLFPMVKEGGMIQFLIKWN